MTIYTIGHSNHTREAFAALLRQYKIDLLIDVRSKPRSRFAHFSGARMQQWLECEYRWEGDKLGGLAPAVDNDYLVNVVAPISKTRNIALMCAEGDPDKCHRKSTLAPVLEAQGYEVVHIVSGLIPPREGVTA